MPPNMWSPHIDWTTATASAQLSLLNCPDCWVVMRYRQVTTGFCANDHLGYLTLEDAAYCGGLPVGHGSEPADHLFQSYVALMQDVDFTRKTQIPIGQFVFCSCVQSSHRMDKRWEDARMNETMNSKSIDYK
ncbi:unnamed protein product [Protopolystoma xenopodis]|uniref:Uncharacterized protein n=1 Tax=Protopolystoma xenopodis TaxID=117903 RepID=A0A3S5CNB1_9PLAT|nr:unnamed protein product [Protopolystoma xenopodis]